MILLAFLALSGLASPPVMTPPPPPPPPAATDWAALAHGDIEAGYAIMRRNHPGFVNPEDPGFKATLEGARAAGNAAAARAGDLRGYEDALASFSTALGDGHAALRANSDEKESPTRWPGFLAAWRGDRMLVVEGEPSAGFGPGSEVVACDGTPIAELLVQRLMPRATRLHEAGQWWGYGTRVLTDSGLVAGPPPRRCTFRNAAATQEVALTYSDVPSDWMMRYWKAVNGGYSEVGLTEPRPGLFVAGLPSFQPGASGVKQYEQLFADLASRHKALETARAVVLDLRFNQGGSSAWPRNAARALWGEKALSTRMEAYNRPVEIAWRASPDNIAYLEGLDATLRGNGQADVADEIKALAARMKAEAAAGRALTVEEPADLSAPVPKPAPTTLRTPVYVIVPGQCASACLDALDMFTRFDDVTLIGAPSSGDSLYMEVRREALPSGKGEAIIPIKVWQHRPRGGGTIYRPRIELRQADWSTDAFLDAIEADLSKRVASR
jgi:hypothetical protein